MRNKGRYILWLPLWYPNRTEPYSGDFIRRHAQAASVFYPIEIIVAIRDTSLPPGSVEQVKEIYGSVTENIIYYNSPNPSKSLIGRAGSFLMYRRILSDNVRNLIRKRDSPLAVHVHVYGKNAYVAYRLCKQLKLPLFYTEHSTGFLKESADFIYGNPGIKKILFKRFIRAVACSTFVSGYLAASIVDILGNLNYRIIPNVVDDTVFKPSEISVIHDKTRFIHISTLGYQKNFEDIVKAFGILALKNCSFEFHVFGPVSGQVRSIVRDSGLLDFIHLEGEQPHEKILPFLQQADALLLYSRYETFGCVVAEANACGIPVIVSDIPVMHELVRDGENGLFVPGNDFQKLATQLEAFILNPLRPDKNRLHQQVIRRYGMKAIGEMFKSLYESMIP